MKQRIPNPKTKEQLFGMQDKTLITYCYDNYLLFDRALYNVETRIDFINTVYELQFEQIQEDFIDVVDNPAYFERDGNTRYYFICLKCGNVTKDHIDNNSKYLDLHGKCGNPMYYRDYTDKDIYKFKKDREESQYYGEYFMRDFYAREEQESINRNIKKYKTQWYYGYK